MASRCVRRPAADRKVGRQQRWADRMARSNDARLLCDSIADLLAARVEAAAARDPGGVRCFTRQHDRLHAMSSQAPQKATRVCTGAADCSAPAR